MLLVFMEIGGEGRNRPPLPWFQGELCPMLSGWQALFILLPLLSRTTLPEAVHAHFHAQWDSAIEVTHNLSAHVLTHLLRDCLPRSLRQQRIERGQACLEENLAVARIVRCLALALDQAQCRQGVSTQSELGLRLLSVL